MRILRSQIYHCFLCVFIILSYFGALPISQAHEIIPRALQEYVVTHPNATPEEIQNFAEGQSPEFAGRYKNGADILAIIRNNQTSLLDNMYDFFKL